MTSKNLERRTEIFYSRLTRQERTWLETMASAERRTISDMIRQAVAEAAQRRGLEMLAEPQPEGAPA